MFPGDLKLIDNTAPREAKFTTRRELGSVIGWLVPVREPLNFSSNSRHKGSVIMDLLGTESNRAAEARNSGCIGVLWVHLPHLFC
jgi:hypothetical protein